MHPEITKPSITPEELKEAVEIAKKVFQSEKQVISPSNMIGGTKPALRPVYDKNGQRLGRVCHDAGSRITISKNGRTLGFLRERVWI